MTSADEPFTLQVLSSQGEVIYSARLGSASSATPSKLTREQLALYVGWTMGTLCSDRPSGSSMSIVDPLRTEQELPLEDHKQIEIVRLGQLLDALALNVSSADLRSGLSVNAGGAADMAQFLADTAALNVRILEVMAMEPQPEIQFAYELGQNLWKTGNPQGDVPPEAALAWALSRSRISSVQGSLAAMSVHFPPHAAAVVAASMGRWSEFAEVILKGGQSDKSNLVETMHTYLRRQTGFWLTLLTGTDTTAGLRGSVKVSRRVLQRYGPLLLSTAAVLAVILYVIVTYTSGITKVVTFIVAVGASLGISAKSAGSLIGTLISRELKQPIFRQGEEEAMVWAITTLPPIPISRLARWRLRRRGVEPASGIGQV